MESNPLRDYREKNNLSQAELAKLLGCSQGMVSHIEHGRRGISPKKANEWSPKLGIPREQLCALFEEAA